MAEACIARIILILAIVMATIPRSLTSCTSLRRLPSSICPSLRGGDGDGGGGQVGGEVAVVATKSGVKTLRKQAEKESRKRPDEEGNRLMSEGAGGFLAMNAVVTRASGSGGFHG